MSYVFFDAILPDLGSHYHAYDVETGDVVRISPELFSGAIDINFLLEPVAMTGGRMVFGTAVRDAPGLMITDGTVAGTQEITVSGFFPSTPGLSEIVSTGDALFVRVGGDLFISDGTTAGTVAGVDLSVQGMYLHDNRLLLKASDGETLTSLWISDGTEAGTQALGRITASLGDNTITVGGLSYFMARPGLGMPDPAGQELWVSDGTAAGTRMVADLTPGTASSTIGLMTDASALGAGQMIFTRFNRDTRNSELWITDGTEAGTRMLPAPLLPNQSLVSIVEAVSFGDEIWLREFYSGELWSTDGTTTTRRTFTGLPDPEDRGTLDPGGLRVSPDGQRLFMHGWSSDTDPRGGVADDDAIYAIDQDGTLTLLFANSDDGARGVEQGIAVGTGYLTWYDALRPGTLGSTGAELFFVDDSGGTLVQEFTPGPDGSSGRHFISSEFAGLASSGGADVVAGTIGADLVHGLGGNDRIDGGAGNDTLSGGLGSDTLIGGEGDDRLTGGETADDRRDVIFGGAGNDTIDGGYGNDELRGDAGDDVVAGGFGGDTVIGGAGNDSITGSALGDVLFGGDGDDFINGGFGFDRVNGGAGADEFFHLGVADHGSDWIQDYDTAEGDTLVFGRSGATAAQFQVNTTFTAGAGAAGVEEAFVIYRPTGQIIWALIDGGGEDTLTLTLGGQSFDLVV